MRQNLLYLLILSLLAGCQKSIPNYQSISYALPEGADVIVSTNDITNSEEHLKNLRLFGIKDYDTNLKLSYLDSIALEEIAIGLYKSKPGANFAISGFKQSITDSLGNDLKKEFANSEITRINADSIFRLENYENIVISDDSLLLAGNEQPDNSFLVKLNRVKRSAQGFNVLTNTSIDSIPLSLLKSKSLKSGTKGELFLNVNSNNRKLTYSGIMKPDSISQITFDQPHDSKLLDFIPTSASQWQILAIDPNDSDLTELNESNLELDSITDFQSLSLEIGSLRISENDLMIFSLGSISLLEQDLNLTDITEDYRDIPIYAFNWNNASIRNERTVFEEFSSNYLALVENYLILAESLESLKSCLSSFLNNQTVSQSNGFKALSLDIRSSFSYMAYGNESTISNLFPGLDLDYNRSYFQLSLEDDFIHVNGILADYKKIRNAAPVEEILSVSIDKDILSTPQLVKNHLNGGMDILVQDIENNLYLISNRGKIFWKKRVNGPILGKVGQIDMYKNGRLQLAFCTNSKLYVLDRNGKDVSPFPKNFRDPITQPLAVFDYDNKRNYRLLISQGKELLMLDGRGKRVSGFKYDESKRVTSIPKHFRVGRKDYIVFKGEDQFKILNRRGKMRINIRDKIAFSDNEIFLYQSQFTTTSKNGELVQVDTKGKIRKQALNLPQDHKLVTTSRTLVTQTENRLNIKLKNVDLDYGIYSDPQIFYLNDKIYISTTDKQSKKVLLFDSQAQAIKGFPIFGNSSASMGNIDNSRGLEMVVQTDVNSLSIYKLN